MDSGLNRIGQLLEHEVELGHEIGISMGVIHNGEMVYRKEVGFADQASGLPMKEDTIFRMYSMTKPVTAVAMMILLERGMIDLLDPVSMYLDGFKEQKVWVDNQSVDVVREVTIRDLLSMTSGIPYPGENCESERVLDKVFQRVQETNENGGRIGTVEMCNLIGEAPLVFQPGTKWLYGASADICGAIVEVVTGVIYSEFLKKEIFEPLGMKDTGFYVPEEKQGRFAELYTISEETGTLEPCSWRHLALTDCKSEPAFESGGAGLVSTLDDYSKFVQMLLNGGTYQGTKILSNKMVQFIRLPQVSMEVVGQAGWESNLGYGYGNFMRIKMDSMTACSLGEVDEFGWDGWAGTYFFIDPTNQVAMIYLVQRTDGVNPKLMRKLRNIIYSSLL